uniref:ABC transporter E family member 1 n=1 Tax=Piliocolobus tephrosceles TaxID=591936 RepID=A0A8C9GTI8_9PRIM
MRKKNKEDLYKENKLESSKLRIAIVNSDKCKPKKCNLECKKNCPIVKTGKFCIEVENSSKIAYISETLCIGCGICVKKCPFSSITIINLPTDLNKDVVHRYGPNTFKLHRLPTPKLGQILGLVGTNGIGKSTALKILSSKLKPNLGKYNNPPEWRDILSYFRGNELQIFFTKLLEEKLTPIIKPQNVDMIPKQVKGNILDIINKKDKYNQKEKYLDILELNHLLDRNVEDLSGGELQRFALLIAIIAQNTNVYMFDEPTSYLDIKQRISMAKVIHGLVRHDNYIIVVEHDLSILDYLSDYICCLWGQAGVYGVVTVPFSVRDGINIFLDGFIPTENLRIRDESLNFKLATDQDATDESKKRLHFYEYPKMVKKLNSFTLTIEKGFFSESEIFVLLGQNGSGKSTFIRLFAGLIQPDNLEEVDILKKLSVSYKPQQIQAKYTGTVRQLLMSKLKGLYNDPYFNNEIIKPLKIDNILDNNVLTLSGGELQKIAIIVTLAKIQIFI